MGKREKTVRRRHPLRTLFIVLLLICGTGVYLYTQQNFIKTEVYTVSSARLPESFSGFRIVEVSDLHGKQFGENNADLLAAVAALRPDVIAVTGDLIDDQSQLDALPALAQALARIAPTYYVNGNHEWDCKCINKINDILSENGVTPLNNEYVTLERNGESIVLAGVQDPLSTADYSGVLPALMEKISAAQGDPYVVLLAHRNTEYARFDAARVDVAVTGHGHGGVVRLPFVGGIIGNDRLLFPTHSAGLYQLSFTQMVVSRGLGNEGYTFRVNNRPDLPVIILERAG